jgi:Icc-related predicted phosphoesterase
VTDLHGSVERYNTLFQRIEEDRPDALFMGGDILPSPFTVLTRASLNYRNFIPDFLVTELNRLKQEMADAYPTIFVILGNDDGRMEEEAVISADRKGLWQYCHVRPINWQGFTVYGYSYIPPTPFRLKDWERYDVSRLVDPGCIAPEDGAFTVQVSERQLKHATISEDLEKLSGGANFDTSIFLFHSPPYQCNLDRAALDGKMVDHAPMDVHVGSIAIQRFIGEKQPLLTLHGHIHESTRITGSWQETFGKTQSFNAAHDGPELSLVTFDPHHPENASRQLI